MASNNSQNLISLAERSEEERKKIARMGAQASIEVRRENKAMKKMLEACLEMKNNKGLTYRQLATMGLINGAIKGNANNYKTILEVLGELKPEEEKKNDGIILDLVEALNNAKKD